MDNKVKRSCKFCISIKPKSEPLLLDLSTIQVIAMLI